MAGAGSVEASGAAEAALPVSATQCPVCGAARTDACESAGVRSNVRAFRHERFALWRCAGCRSIHAAQPVDLDHYYRGYPVLTAELDWKFHVVYGGLLARLIRAGLKPEHRILDYGCGNGLLVKYLQSRGFAHTVGYDRYAAAYRDPAVLERRYDCIVSQDVIEHVDDPLALLAEFDRLAEPGAIISIGTPDADALDLRDAENYVHALHAPYHRHILSAEALREAGKRRGWAVTRYYDTMYNNTLFPTMNPRFVLHYVRAHDDVFDLVAEPIKVSWKLLSPATLLYALFGFFFDRHTDVQVMFKKPDAARLAAG